MVKIGVILTRIIRWCFYGCLVTGMVFVLKDFAVLKYMEDAEVLPHHQIQHLVKSELPEGMLDKKFARCIHSPSKIFCLMSSEKELRFLQAETAASVKNLVHSVELLKSRRHPAYAAVYDFHRLMQQLKLEVTLLEPSMLFCMLSSEKKLDLVSKGFNIRKFLGEENVITFTVSSSHSATLNSLAASPKIKKYGFRHQMMKNKITFLDNALQAEHEKRLTTHHFFERRWVFIHLVVFFERGYYFWHGEINKLLLEDGLKPLQLFGSAAAAYKKFPTTVLYKDLVIPTGIRIPSNLFEFLWEIEFSTFIECKIGTLRNSPSQKNDVHSTNIIENTFRSAYQEITRLLPYTKVIIFGKTLLGWYRTCRLEQGTLNFDFAVLVSDLKIFNDKILRNRNSSLPLKLKHSLGSFDNARQLRFDCYGMEVRLSYLYESNSRFWAANYNLQENYYIRHNYPKFKLCSGDLLSYKVYVPCEPEVIIEEDFGIHWKYIISNGSRTHWSHSKKKIFWTK